MRGKVMPFFQRCKVCGRADHTNFHVPDDVWYRVVPQEYKDSVVCLCCFDHFATAKGEDYIHELEEEFVFAGNKVFCSANIFKRWSTIDFEQGRMETDVCTKTCKVCLRQDYLRHEVIDRKLWKQIVPVEFHSKNVCLACLDDFASGRNKNYSKALGKDIEFWGKSGGFQARIHDITIATPVGS